MQSSSELVLWLALQRIFITRPRTAFNLLEKYGNPKNIFEASKSGGDFVFEELRHFNKWDICEQEIDRCKKLGIKIIVYTDECYPELLKSIYDPPLVLTLKGKKTDILSGPCVAIVGARKATEHGKEVAFELAEELAASGIIVVSGMAYGIDAAAHAGAVNTGKTIAVWGTGLDCCHPQTLIGLSKEITNVGCIISEFPLGTSAYKSNFPQRNRIISGLSLGVVVVEAAAKSGSLITARFALEQGRDVFAMPGQARGIQSEGSHMLLRNGAIFAEKGDDIIAAISNYLPANFKNPRHLAADENNAVLKFLSNGETHTLDSLIEKSGLPCAKVLEEVTNFIITGIIEELPDKSFRRKK